MAIKSTACRAAAPRRRAQWLARRAQRDAAGCAAAAASPAPRLRRQQAERPRPLSLRPQSTTAAFSQLDRVSILAEALPYMQKFAGKTIVVKYGGAAMKDPTLKVRPLSPPPSLTGPLLLFVALQAAAHACSTLRVQVAAGGERAATAGGSKRLLQSARAPRKSCQG